MQLCCMNEVPGLYHLKHKCSHGGRPEGHLIRMLTCLMSKADAGEQRNSTMLPSGCKHKDSHSPLSQGHLDPDAVSDYLVPVSSYLQTRMTSSLVLVKFYPV